MNILVTGGAGYIGSHTCVKLIEDGHSVTILDNLSNSKLEVVRRIKEIAGKECGFYKCDIRDFDGLCEVFSKNSFDAVIHFAGLKAVGESVLKPLEYYENNVFGTITLCRAMAKYKIYKLVFSSSATVYGTNEKMPLTEDMPTGAINPYGWTKTMIEQILRDLCASDENWSVTLLRYFNPLGAHKSGRIGEDPSGIPNNLMPYITQVAAGRLEKLSVFGNDYSTKDGTAVRDYIHVSDLADGHVKALKKIEEDKGVFTYNLGTGRGYSVLEVINAFERATGVKIPYEITARRPGDAAIVYASTEKAERELGFKARRSIEDMCFDSWNWQKNNVYGYGE